MKMGMFDEIKCEVQLPDERLPAGIWCQTKSFYCCMNRFTITTQGRLIFHKTRSEQEGEWEVRPGVKLPRYRSIPLGEVDMEYHGDVLFGGGLPDRPYAQYVARFTHGQLESILPYEAISELHRTWFYSKD